MRGLLRAVPSHYWVWVGLVLGAAGGWVDLIAVRLLGVDITWGQADATLPVGLLFTVNSALLGAALGHVLHLRRQTRQQQAQLVEFETLAAVGRLSASVAHEVRNPLGVIRASASHIREELQPGGAERACQFIVEEVDRLDDFITELLAYARPLRLEPAEVPVSRLVDRARQVAAKHLAPLQCHVVLPDQDTLRADEDTLGLVLAGLLINAAQTLSECGGSQVEVRAHRRGDAWCLEVADDGPGIAEAHREHLFEPFFTTRASGSGLGLAMAQRVVRAHGGTIETIGGAGLGPEGAGACFRITLPGAAA